MTTEIDRPELYPVSFVRLSLPAFASIALFTGAAFAAGATAPADNRAPAVSVAAATRAELREIVQLTGSFVAREEILINPEVEGFSIVEILVEEGDTVVAGQVLARLNRESLDVQLAQNSAQIARAEAAINQATASVAEAKANRTLTAQQLERTQTLVRSGNATNDLLDQRIFGANAAAARVTSAENALGLAQADLVLAQAQRRDIELRLSRTEIKTRVGGIVSRRAARLGAVASAAATDAMFRIIADGAVELEADVAESTLAKLRIGQPAQIDTNGSVERLGGRVRLVSPEVGRTNRLGRVRVALTSGQRPPIGSFGRAGVEVARSEGVTVPLSAVFFQGSQVTVQVVKDGIVETRRIVPGLRADGQIEIREGLSVGEQVVAVSGSFVRNGDRVNPTLAKTQ
ncbi:MAG: efflux RND transporter periplasmic adaptor subunit [Alphaproteobacteria bacterium]